MHFYVFEKNRNVQGHPVIFRQVELEKVRSDMELEAAAREQELATLREEAEELRRNAEAARREQEKLRETLQTQFQAEKDQIVKVRDVT